jgi:hypothetical protein
MYFTAKYFTIEWAMLIDIYALTSQHAYMHVCKFMSVDWFAWPKCYSTVIWLVLRNSMGCSSMAASFICLHSFFPYCAHGTDFI